MNPTTSWLKKHWKKLVCAGLFCMAIVLSRYKLTESPPTWTDEGIIINTARVWSETGKPGIQVAPHEYASAGTVTTSYTVTGPIALVYKIFGEGLLQARLVMFAYLFILFVLLYLLLRKYISPALLVPAFALMVTLPPIYGDGKNVLGEIPGLCFFLLFLYTAYRIREWDRGTWIDYSVLGLSAGLFAITKPIFLLFIPAFFVAVVMYYLRGHINVPAFLKKGELRNSISFIAAFIIPCIVWLLIQFSADSLSHILSVYANPGKLDAYTTALSNAKVMLTNIQPLYFLFLFAVWLASFIIRAKKRITIPFPESVAFIFSTLVFLAFFRVPAYYRYFFPAQFLALLFFTSSLSVIVPNWPRCKYVLLILVIIFQMYGLFFTSWVAQSYASTQSAELAKYFSTASSASFFLYQSPEVATFISTDNYYQLLYVAPQLSVGSSSLAYLEKGIPDAVIVHDDQISHIPAITFKLYVQGGSVARYAIFKRKP